MRFAWLVSMIAASGCSLIYDPSDLTDGVGRDGGSRDAPALDRGTGADRPATDSPGTDAGPRPDSGLNDLPTSCVDRRDPGPNWYACPACALCPGALAVPGSAPTTGDFGIGISAALVAGPMLMVASVENMLSAAVVLEYAISPTEITPVGVRPIATDAITPRDVAIRRWGPAEIGVVVLAYPRDDFSGVWVGALATPGLTGTFTELTGRPAPMMTFVVGRPAVTGGTRFGCRTEGHWFWRVDSDTLSGLALGSLEQDDLGGETGFTEHLVTTERADGLGVAGTAGDVVFVPTQQPPDNAAVIWSTRGGTHAAVPGDPLAVGASHGAALLSNGNFVVAWATAGETVRMRTVRCETLDCADAPGCDRIECTDAGVAFFEESLGLHGPIALEGMPDRGVALVATRVGGTAPTLVLLDDALSPIAEFAIVPKVAGGAVVLSATVDTLVEGGNILVGGAVGYGTIGGPVTSIVLYAVQIPGGCE